MLFTLVIVEVALCTPESSVASFPIFSLTEDDTILPFLRGGACSGTLKNNFNIIINYIKLILDDSICVKILSIILYCVIQKILKNKKIYKNT